MRFEEVYSGWQGKRLTQQEAGDLLGVSERTFRRQIGRFEAEGVDVHPVAHELEVTRESGFGNFEGFLQFSTRNHPAILQQSVEVVDALGLDHMRGSMPHRAPERSWLCGDAGKVKLPCTRHQAGRCKTA